MEAHQRGIPMNIDNLIMRFTDDFNGTNTLAQCRYGQTPTIAIGIEFWNWADVATREQVVFHELAHCILGRKHLDDSIVYQGEHIPKSIMSTILFSEYYYKKFRMYYIDEMFAGR
jgi:hypothetical protein